jgi:1,5-anhydro-D-fructose reductase (1,5-anhydro-D-mannitol-forming)
MDEIGWALIGASFMAENYVAGVIDATDGATVRGVFSSSLERGRSLAERCGLPRAYSSLAQLLADDTVQAVYISTTNELHAQQTVAAARAGKHVLCEKPLALSLDEATAMIRAAEKAGVVLATCHNFRGAATHRKLRELVESGALGAPVAMRIFHAEYLPPRLQTWRLDGQKAGAGAILDLTPHDADVVRFVLGDEIEEVTAIAVNQGLAKAGIEDAVMGVMRTRRGVPVSFHDAFTVPHAGTGVQVHGTDASVVATGVMAREPLGEIVLLRNGREPEPVKVPDRIDPFARTVDAFSSAVRGTGEPLASGVDGARALAVALATASSARSGRRECVPQIESLRARRQ